MDAKDKRYVYDRFGSKGARVGQAVQDIISQDNPTYTAEDILDGYSQKFCDELEKTVQQHRSKYTGPFYILVLTHKEMWAANVVRNWFIPRQTPPYALDLMTQYPHHMKTLYLIDAEKGKAKVCWTLPGLQDCQTVAASKSQYDPNLVQWIEDCFSGKLDRDSYSFEQFQAV